MSIPVTCPKCRTSFRVKDEWAGKKGKCPQCKALLEVPAPPESDPGGVKKSPVEPGAVEEVERGILETSLRQSKFQEVHGWSPLNENR